MKTIKLSFLMACIAVVANAQFSEEPIKTFDDGAWFKSFTYKNGDQIFLNGGDFDEKKSENKGQINVYDLSFTYKNTINLSTVPGFMKFGELLVDNGSSLEALCICVTEGIFSNDNLMEFIVITEDGFAIINENCHEIFRKNYTNGWSVEYYSSFRLLKTKNGNLLEVHLNNSKTEIYALPGYSLSSLRSTSIQQLNNPYPNPAKTFIHLPYTLPQEIKEGTIQIFNTQGQLIKTFRVDDTSEYMRLETSNLPSGNYFYTLEARGQRGEGKQFIVGNYGK